MAEIAFYDQHTRGLAGHYLRASAERQQVIACFFACSKFGPLSSDVEFLIGDTLQEILAATFDTVPPNIRPALRRAGSRIHHPIFYRLLAHLLRRMDKGERKRFSYIEKLNFRTLLKWRALPQNLRSSHLLSALATHREMRALCVALDTLVQNGADETRLVSDLKAIRSRKDLERTIDRHVGHLSLPTGPVPSSTFYHPITSVNELRTAALQLRNCAANYVFAVLENSSSFARIEVGQHVGIAHLEREAKFWSVGDIKGPRNTNLPDYVELHVLKYLKEHGVGAHCIGGQSEWDVVRNFCPRPWSRA